MKRCLGFGKLVPNVCLLGEAARQLRLGWSSHRQDLARQRVGNKMQPIALKLGNCNNYDIAVHLPESQQLFRNPFRACLRQRFGKKATANALGAGSVAVLSPEPPACPSLITHTSRVSPLSPLAPRRQLPSSQSCGRRARHYSALSAAGGLAQYLHSTHEA